MQYTQLSRRSAGGKIDWEKQYLTFIPVENAVFKWTQNAVGGHLEYSINGGQTWVTIANGKSTPTITAGSKVIWRGNLEPSRSYGIGTFSASGNYNAYGNIMSLLYYDNYYNSQLDSTKHKYVFYRLFESDTHLLSAPLLTSTTLVDGCYKSMFMECKSLIAAPKLPAITLATECYAYMFSLCYSLTIAPELPAISLAIQCYDSMFYSCKALITAPKLPVTTLVAYCYYQMFCYCSNLITAPELPATNLTGDDCYSRMFYDCTKLNYIKALFKTTPSRTKTDEWVSGVAATGIFVKNSEATWTTTGVDGIPTGWTVVIDNS